MVKKLFQAGILFVFMLLWGISVSAESANKGIKAIIPVKCEEVNSDESFSYVLTKVEEYSDTLILPEKLTLSSGESGSFEVICTLPGVYKYELTQEKGTDINTTYDSTIYTVDIYVTEDENGSLNSETIVYVKGNNEKKDSCYFKNIKEKEIPPVNSQTSSTDKVKTGDNSNIILYLFIACTSLIIMLIGKEKVVSVKKK